MGKGFPQAANSKGGLILTSAEQGTRHRHVQPWKSVGVPNLHTLEVHGGIPGGVQLLRALQEGMASNPPCWRRCMDAGQLLGLLRTHRPHPHVGITPGTDPKWSMTP